MTSITRWEPNREFMTLRDAMNRLFEDSFVGNYTDRDGNAELRLPLEVYSTDHDIVVKAAVPGLKPDEVEITIEGDTVTLRGEYARPVENVNYLISERAWGRFSRTLQLNVPVEADKAEAVFENGLLTLTLPKAEAVRPKVIPIKAKK
ncbi:MAG: Hsp20/alpha crystallin family protein [Anaerolineales bacterium]|nr:Hsp20/alpha crystallin family protein [Anaerolineales bacterium]